MQLVAKKKPFFAEGNFCSGIKRKGFCENGECNAKLRFGSLSLDMENGVCEATQEGAAFLSLSLQRKEKSLAQKKASIFLQFAECNPTKIILGPQFYIS